jgi:hypothetical protein
LMYLSMTLDIAISLITKGRVNNDYSGMVENGYLKIGINKHVHAFVYTKLLVYSLLTSKKNTASELEEMVVKYSDDKEYYKFVTDVLLWYYRKKEEHSKEFRLIKKLDSKNLLYNIDSRFFLLMIDSGLAVNDLTNVTNLYLKYKKCVSNNDQLLGEAYIEMYKRNYNGALKALSGINLKDPFYYEQVINIKLMVYKEKNEKELYRYTKDAFSHWKKRRLKKKAE